MSESHQAVAPANVVAPRSGHKWSWEVVVGALALLAAALLNKWAIERIFAPDEHIGSIAYLAPIVLFQLVLFGFGIRLVVPRWRFPLSRPLFHAGLAGLLAGIAIGTYGNLKALHFVDPNRELRLAWERVIANEELLLYLTPKLKNLTASAMNLRIPDHKSLELFDDDVLLVDLADSAGQPSDVRVLPEAIEVPELSPASEVHPVPLRKLQLWRSLLDGVAYFEHAKFYLIKGELVRPGGKEYESEIGFKGLARLKSVQRWDRNLSPCSACPTTKPRRPRRSTGG